MQKKYIKVLDHKELVRDLDSKAIINIDNESMDRYKKEKMFKLKLNKIVEEYDELKKDVEEIKILLIEILDKK